MTDETGALNMDALPPSLVSSVSLQPSSLPSLLPVSPRVPVGVRVATMADLPFVDALQKRQAKQVGFFPTKAIEGKIGLGQVLVANVVDSGQWVVGSENGGNTRPQLSTTHYPLPTPAGYLIGQDQYFKRDDVGVIYQINVIPEMRRSLVAATLLKAQFERSAYGCKLYCCWCAQDIEANKFWESMGFVPLAFRAGSAKKARTHIFWQKRIRSGDETTPWWFPSQTTGGSIREDRIVLPIPPGVRWSDAMPRVLPEAEDRGSRIEDRKGRPSSARSSGPGPRPSTPRPAMLWFKPAAPTPAARPAKPPRAKAKNDPRLVAAARELRDRWLEEVNAGRFLPGTTAGKYDVSRRAIVATTTSPAALPSEQALLPAA